MAAWAVDREFVHILGAFLEVSNLFWHDFEFYCLSGVCSGLCMDSEAGLRRGMNSIDFYVGASSQLARIATISGRPAKSRKKVFENICVFLSKVDRVSFSLSTGAS